MDGNRKAVAGCCCALSTIGVFIITLISFSSLGITEQGLDYAKISRTLDNKVYGPGYHYLGFAHKFITYPSTVINMEFSDSESADRPAIESRTDDGLTIKFKASF